MSDDVVVTTFLKVKALIPVIPILAPLSWGNSPSKTLELGESAEGESKISIIAHLSFQKS